MSQGTACGVEPKTTSLCNYCFLKILFFKQRGVDVTALCDFSGFQLFVVEFKT